MKSFGSFITEMQNRESPFHGNIRPGSNYPKNLPYIRQPNKELDMFKSWFKMARRKDVSDKEMNKYQKGINDNYKQITNPVKKA